MRALTNVLLASGSLLGLSGCLPDFSPDPLKSDGEDEVDGGSASDASRPNDGGPRNDGGGGTPRDSGPRASEDGGGTVNAPDAGGTTDDGAPPGCDLRGKWFVNEHFMTNVLGALQVANNWYYWEIDQEGSDLTVAVSTGCGADLNAARGQPLSAKADDSAAWPSYATHKSYAGRRGTVNATEDGCEIKFEQDAVVRGATVDAYKDLSVALPTTQQMASGSTPGWEDWDEDGKPGVTLVISGLATGSLYTATRSWTIYDGTAPKDATLLKLGLDWDQVRSNLGSTDSSGILSLNATRHPDEATQFVELAKLNEDQAAGDAPTRCERLRMLAPTITPNASKF